MTKTTGALAWPGGLIIKDDLYPAASICVTLALPPASLHAHNRGNWRSKAAPTRAYREEAALLSKQAMRKKRGIYPFEEAELGMDIYFPNLRRRDTLNVVQGLKPAIDGLVDAGIILDDDWQRLKIGHIRSYLDKDNPRVCLTITTLKNHSKLKTL